MIDSHAHIYADAFDEDQKSSIERAREAGVTKILMPNIDSSSIEVVNKAMLNYPNFCFKMMGLHPCSVKDDYQEELSVIKQELDVGDSIAVGEIGVDLYWDKSTQKIQEEAFLKQCEWAIEKDLPIVIHSRESIDLIVDLVNAHYKHRIKGVFHCFTGSIEQAKRIEDLNMYVGIGGVITFKNSDLREVIKGINLDHVLIETDAPYLAPTPYRGKRNEPAYVSLVLEEIAKSLGMEIKDLEARIDSNTLTLFNI